MKASIVCIGTELTTGRNLDTNSRFLAQNLFECGIDIASISNFPDNYSILKEELNNIIKSNDMIIITGGLGPTQDDITKDVIKDILDIEMVYSDHIYKRIESSFKKRGYKTPPSNLSQAEVFRNSKIIYNNIGTAPGFIIEKEKKIIVLLPGPPCELIPMFKADVITLIKGRYKKNIFKAIYRLTGIAESYISDKLKDIDADIKSLKGDITYLAKPNLIDVLITSRHNISKIKKIIKKIPDTFKNNIYTDKWETIYEVIAGLLKKHKLSLSLAESCTGGLISKTVTDLSGSSKYFKFGVTTYSNESKMKILNVKKDILIKYGAVSRQTAREMIKGLKTIIDTDISVSVTGIAGPGGATPDKPVGLVYIGVSVKEEVVIYKFVFNGSRDRIRDFILNKTFELLFQKLKEL